MDKPRVFVAGAAGAIGLPLVRLLVARGYEVIGTTRKPGRARQLAALGVTPAVVDVCDGEALARTLRSQSTPIVIHQLTDLPYGLPPERMDEGRKRNAALRLTGTRNLIDALAGLPVSRLIVQSIAFMYADGPVPHGESDPLASDDLARFERIALECGCGTTLLRYGRFYGPRTGVANSTLPCRVNVLAAACATVLALESDTAGIYNVTEDRDYADNRRFIAATGWDPGSTWLQP